MPRQAAHAGRRLRTDGSHPDRLGGPDDPEDILTLGVDRSSYIRSPEAGRARMQEDLRWYLYDHLEVCAGEQVPPYATLSVAHPPVRGAGQ